MLQRLLACLRFLVWPLFISSFLIQCKKTEDTPNAVTPVTHPISTTAPPLTEQAIAKTGLLPTETNTYEKLPIYVAKGFKGGRLAAVTNVDLSTEMPPIGNQGQQGSCNAWASAYAMRSYLYHQDTKKPYVLSTGSLDSEAVFSPAYVYNQLNKGRDAGSSTWEAYSLMVKEGVCTYKNMPYQEAYPGYLNQPNAGQKQNAGNYKISGFGRTLITTASLKAILAQGIAVQVNVRLDQNFKQLSEKVGGEFVWKVFNNASHLPGRDLHAVVLVGFDDVKNAFKLMNSWGATWANKGFIWMDYELTSQVIAEAYIPYTTSKFAQLAVYDPSIAISGTGTWMQKQSNTRWLSQASNTTTFVIDNIIYACGNYRSPTAVTAEVIAYNSTTNQWVQKNAPPPDKYGGSVWGSIMTSFTVNNKSYVMAGKLPYEYDPTKDSWTQKKLLSQDKAGRNGYAVTFGYKGKGYYGLTSTIISSDEYNKQAGTLWEYNPLDDSWQQKTQIPTDWIIGTVGAYGMINDKLYLIYSQVVKDEVPNAMLVYEYDFVKNTWSKKQPLTNVERGISGVGGVLNNKLYCGFSSLGTTTTTGFYAYEPGTDKWTEVKSFPQSGRLYNSATSVVANNKLYVGSGSDRNGKLVDDWWEFTP